MVLVDVHAADFAGLSSGMLIGKRPLWRENEYEYEYKKYLPHPLPPDEI